MKAKELMIGDIVTYNNTACKVYCIDSPFERKNDKYNNKFVITLWCDGFVDATEDEIKPIPLTKEILLNNDWEKDYNYYSNTWVCPYYKLNLSYDFDNHALHKSGAPSCGTLIATYVHEFQQKLRAFGLNELAFNFKIN